MHISTSRHETNATRKSASAPTSLDGALVLIEANLRCCFFPMSRSPFSRCGRSCAGKGIDLRWSPDRRRRKTRGSQRRRRTRGRRLTTKKVEDDAKAGVRDDTKRYEMMVVRRLQSGTTNATTGKAGRCSSRPCQRLSFSARQSLSRAGPIPKRCRRTWARGITRKERHQQQGRQEGARATDQMGGDTGKGREQEQHDRNAGGEAGGGSGRDQEGDGPASGAPSVRR